MEKEQIIKALECCSTPSGKRCENCPKVTEDALCMYRLAGDALALIKELTQANEGLYAETKSQFDKISMLTEVNKRLRVVSDMSDATLTDALRIVNEFCDSRVKRAKADTVREIFKEIYSSLDYIEEQMEPEEIPECFFSVREDIDALKVRFEGEGRGE